MLRGQSGASNCSSGEENKKMPALATPGAHSNHIKSRDSKRKMTLELCLRRLELEDQIDKRGMGDPKDTDCHRNETTKPATVVRRAKLISSAPRPPARVGGFSVYQPPPIQTIPSTPLEYPFPFPEVSCNRVRGEMLKADQDF